MFSLLRQTLLVFITLTLVTGVIYPVVMTVVAQVVFPHQANGSLIERDGKLLGSELIGQQFDVGLVEDLSEPIGSDLLGTLEECVAAGLLEEVDVDRFQFTHAIVRSTLYDSIGGTRRVRIHRQIAASIERDLEAGRPVRFSELAHHAAFGARDDDVSGLRHGGRLEALWLELGGAR